MHVLHHFIFLLLSVVVCSISIDNEWEIVPQYDRYLKNVKKMKTKQRQSKEEREYLKYHKCADPAEAYGASYFITKEYMLRTKVEKFNLTWVNCEMGSFVFMKRLNGNTVHHKNVSGVAIQSLDVLDFSVIHLSAYERLQRRHKGLLRKKNKNALKNEVKIEETLKFATSRLMDSVKYRQDTVAAAQQEVPCLIALVNSSYIVDSLLYDVISVESHCGYNAISWTC